MRRKLAAHVAHIPAEKSLRPQVALLLVGGSVDIWSNTPCCHLIWSGGVGGGKNSRRRRRSYELFSDCVEIVSIYAVSIGCYNLDVFGRAIPQLSEVVMQTHTHTPWSCAFQLIIRCRNDSDYEAVKVEFWWRLGDTYAKWAFPGVLVVVVGMAGSNIKQGEAQWDEDETIPKTNKTLLQTSDFDMTCEMVVLALSNCCWAAVRGNW